MSDMADMPDMTTWADLHCYVCGDVFSTPLVGLTDEQLETANPEHARCYE